MACCYSGVTIMDPGGGCCGICGIFPVTPVGPSESSIISLSNAYGCVAINFHYLIIYIIKLR